MKTNFHAKSINAKILQELINRLDELNEAILPYATPLNTKSKRNLFKMGEKSHAFVEKSYEFASANPEFVPSYLDMKEYKDDHQDAHDLLVAVNKAKTLADTLNDIKTTTGSDAMKQSLAFYNHLGLLVKQNVAGAQTIRDELKKRFPRKKRNIIGSNVTEDSAAEIVDQEY